MAAAVQTSPPSAYCHIAGTAIGFRAAPEAATEAAYRSGF
jgi:hypothetical protein